MFLKIKQWASHLKQEVMTLWFAYRDPECPFITRLLIGFIVFYALSPIDLIPDFIPILGYLDEMILLPVFITLAIKLIPEHVLANARIQADEHYQMKNPKPTLWLGVILILSIWILITYHLLIPTLLMFYDQHH